MLRRSCSKGLPNIRFCSKCSFIISHSLSFKSLGYTMIDKFLPSSGEIYLLIYHKFYFSDSLLVFRGYGKGLPQLHCAPLLFQRQQTTLQFFVTLTEAHLPYSCVTFLKGIVLYFSHVYQ